MRLLARVAVIGVLTAVFGASCGIRKCTSVADCGGASCNLSTGTCDGSGGIDQRPRGGGSGSIGGPVGGGGGSSELRCDAESCPNGCCLNGQCYAGQTDRQCGYGGSACNICPSDTTCRSNACVPSIDAVGLPGSACDTPSDCDPVPNGQFVSCSPPEAPDGGPSQFPGGACVALCSPSNGCGNTASTCVLYFNTNGCAANCAAPGGGQSSCRSGYVCTDAVDPVSGDPLRWGVCLPDCRVSGVMCLQTQRCGTNGVCS